MLLAGAGGGAVGTFHISLFATFATFSLVLGWPGPGRGPGRGGGEVINQEAGRHQPQPDPGGPQGLQAPRRVAPDRPCVTNIITCHKVSHPSYPSSIKPSKIIQLTSDKNAKSWWKSSSMCFAKLF